MAYTDLSSTFTYKKLLTHQLMDQLAENDKVFNNKQTGAADFADIIKFDNTKGIAGEVAAGGTYKNLVTFDSSNVVQLGESGIEVRVPADPSNNLGVCTKQYAEALQMFQTQANGSGSSGVSGSLSTILSVAATTRGVLLAVWGKRTSSAHTVSVQVTVDSVVVSSEASPTIAQNDYWYLGANGVPVDSNSTAEGDAQNLINMPFNTSLLLEATSGDANAQTVQYLYAKVP